MNDYVEVKAKVRIPNQKIQDMITSALEGACRYWASYKFPDNWKQKYGSREEIPFKNGNIEVFDVETDELLGYLNVATVQVGLQLMSDCKDMAGKSVSVRHFKNLATDNDDEETADIFLQLAVMGEVVFS